MRRIVVVILLLLAACSQEAEGDGIGQAAQSAGSTEITVEAVEYAFSGVPNTLPTGETTFVLENTGQEPHDLSVARITSAATVEELLELPQREANEQIEDVGNLFARPGDAQRRVLDLAAGRYGYVCFVTAEDGTPHAFLGMAGEFTVA
jgi:hypothetical protein